MTRGERTSSMARPSNGANLTIAQLQSILNNRQADLNKLEKKRNTLQRKLDVVNRDIERIGGSSSGSSRGGTRARNEQSLSQTIEKVMRGASRPMRVGEITDAVEATGYRSNSDNFRAIVNQTLIKERKLFTQTDRGTYAMKKMDKA